MYSQQVSQAAADIYIVFWLVSLLLVCLWCLKCVYIYMKVGEGPRCPPVHLSICPSDLLCFLDMKEAAVKEGQSNTVSPSFQRPSLSTPSSFWCFHFLFFFPALCGSIQSNTLRPFQSLSIYISCRYSISHVLS